MGVMPDSDYPSLKQRLVVLIAYALGLYVLGGVITGSWLPGGGGEWLWWMSAIALYLVSTLGAPFFHRPRDVLTNSIISAGMLFTVDLTSVQTLNLELEVFRWTSFFFVLATAASAIVAIALHGIPKSDITQRGKLSRLSYRFAVSLGNGVVLFTPPALISIVGFYQSDPAKLLWLAAVWIFVVTVKPAELVVQSWAILRQAKGSTAGPELVAQVMRVDDPNIIRVKLTSPDTWKRDRLHTACLPGNRHVHVIPLFVQTQDDELIGTGLCSDVTANNSIGKGQVWTDSDEATTEAIIQTLAATDNPTDLVGFVVEDSSISAIRFEVASAQHLREGAVVFVRDREQTIYYQVLDVVTKEELFTRNPRGSQVVLASQLGTLETDGGFKKYGWVPQMNAPVFLPKESSSLSTEPDLTSDDFALGTVAQTAIVVKASLAEMVDYHTAILGVTGTGKTELALDIIRANLDANRKVFCVDFTGEYKPRLADKTPVALELDGERAKELDELVNAIEYGKYKSEGEKAALDGWMIKARRDIEKQVSEFIESSGAAVGIFELPGIANTRATLRATELYLSAIFAWARKHRRAREILIVLEEAHTVIPESVMFGFDKGETQAVVARMAQIALQGRKFGVGLLLVSQRTALVSKTLLSQCNTCISFAMYDKTGLDYLASVFASEHVRAIPNLQFRQGIAFGKAIKSDRPIIFEIPFDQKKKDASEALNKTLASASTEVPVSEAPAGGPAADHDQVEEDDIPF